MGPRGEDRRRRPRPRVGQPPPGLRGAGPLRAGTVPGSGTRMASLFPGPQEERARVPLAGQGCAPHSHGVLGAAPWRGPGLYSPPVISLATQTKALRAPLPRQTAEGEAGLLEGPSARKHRSWDVPERGQPCPRPAEQWPRASSEWLLRARALWGQVASQWTPSPRPCPVRAACALHPVRGEPDMPSPLWWRLEKHGHS